MADITENLAVQEGDTFSFTSDAYSAIGYGQSVFNYSASWSFEDVTATGADYAPQLRTGTKTIDGSASPDSFIDPNLSAIILNDTVVDSGETFIFHISESFTLVRYDPYTGTLYPPTNYNYSTDVIVVIGEPTPPITTLNVASTIGTEGSESAAQFTVSLTNPLPEPVTITYSTFDGSAVSGKDFESATASTLVIPAMATSATIKIPLVNDSTVEKDEQFSIQVSSMTADDIPASQLVIGTSSATAQISDDDTATVNVSDAPSVTEGTSVGVANFTITLSNPVDAPVAITYSTLDGSALGGSFGVGDYQPQLAQTVVIPVGGTSAVVSVVVLDDNIVEGSEAFSLKIDSVSAPDIPSSHITIGDATGNATILDNEQPQDEWRKMLSDGTLDTKTPVMKRELENVNPDLLDQIPDVVNAYHDVLGTASPVMLNDVERPFLSPLKSHSQHEFSNAIDFAIPKTMTDEQRAQLIKDLDLPDGFRVYLSNQAGTRIIDGTNYPGTDGLVHKHYNHMHIDAGPGYVPHQDMLLF